MMIPKQNCQMNYTGCSVNLQVSKDKCTNGVSIKQHKFYERKQPLGLGANMYNSLVATKQKEWNKNQK